MVKTTADFKEEFLQIFICRINAKCWVTAIIVEYNLESQVISNRNARITIVGGQLFNIPVVFLYIIAP